MVLLFVLFFFCCRCLSKQTTCKGEREKDCDKKKIIIKIMQLICCYNTSVGGEELGFGLVGQGWLKGMTNMARISILV